MLHSENFIQNSQNEQEPPLRLVQSSPSQEQHPKKSNNLLIKGLDFVWTYAWTYAKQNKPFTATLVFCTISLFFYIGQWKPALPPSEVETQTQETVQAPFDESIVNKAEFEELEAYRTQIISLLSEERQNTLIQLAYAFIASANTYTSQEGHKCSGFTVENCLDTFRGTRLTKLKLLDSPNPPQNESSGNARIDRIQMIGKQIDELAAIELAKALSALPNKRTDTQQNLINTLIPRVNEENKMDDLQQRPRVTVKAFELLESKATKLDQASPENTIRIEDCNNLSLEEQEAIGGCYESK